MEVDLERKRTLLALLFLVMAASCAGRPVAPPPTETVTPFVQPTPEPTLTATPTAQAAPTWTPSPSPAAGATSTPAPVLTSEPARQAARPSETPAAAAVGAGATDPLAQGRWQQLIGDCDQARRTFAGLLAAGLAPAYAAEARYRMAQCYERDGAYAEAWATLAELLDRAPATDPYRAPAQFLLGEALTTLGNWPAAEAAYTVYLPVAPELTYLTQQRIGAARRAQGNLAAAAEAYRAALAVSPDWTNTVAIRRALADLALEQGDSAEAVAQYDALRGGATVGAWAAEMQHLAGNALARPAQLLAQAAQSLPLTTVPATATPFPVPAEALARWQAAVDADITSRWAHASIVALLEAGAPVDEFQRGVANYHNGVYALAIAAFDRLRAAEPDGREGQAGYYAGLSYLALDQTAKGLAELEHFINHYPASPLWPDAWLAKARALARADRTAEAIATYRRLAELRPTAPQAPKALWQSALLAEKSGANATAAEAYLAVARAYPAADEGWRAYQAAGLMYFRLADYRRAADTWREMAGQPQLAAFTRPVAYFWLGRAQLALGEVAAARQAWQNAVTAGPESFYGLRAAAWAAGQPTARVREDAPVATGEPAAPTAGSPEAEAAEIAAWLRTWAGEGTLALPQGVTADADWQRGQTLLVLGRRADALSQWERVRRRQADNPWGLAALSLAFRDAGAHRLSLLAAEQVAAKWGGLMRDAPPALQRLAYPLPYADLIRAEAARQRLDPRLLAAIIRQESRFEGGATSVAGAQGLMQVMPGTAAGIARQMNWAGFEPQQAYWPYVNVAFGAFYVRQWLSHFGGSLFAALAAYNGGPGNATTWYNRAPDDDDLLAALITFNETRVYVQAVWTNYEAYRRLYP